MRNYVVLLLLMSFSNLTSSQNSRIKGKIIKNYGATFDVKKTDIKTDTSAVFKVIFDVSRTSEKLGDTNKHLETAARFLNMHAHEGMKVEQLKVALTIHGSAWKDVLNNDAYEQRFGVKNPNSELIKALKSAGVDLILCGQTASFRKIDKAVVMPEVKFALSAMTALLQYQNKGYQFIKF